jgi:sugar O-acyltransferase (sialic acid O-acetyltransferase NeuD family)
MKNILGIIGAGVLGQHIAHYAKLSGQFSSIVFFDDIMMIGSENKFGTIEGKISNIDVCIEKGNIQNLLIGIGYKHMELRENLFRQFAQSVNFPNLIYKSCYIDDSSAIGYGNVFLPGCIIDKGCTIGNNNFFNPGCIIAHDNIIHDHSYFGPAVITSSFINIGSCCFFGTGTKMVDHIVISDYITTGAGTLITKNINERGIYKGIPGKQIIRDPLK